MTRLRDGLAIHFGSTRSAVRLGLLLVAPLLACEAHRVMVLGVSTSPAYVEAARLAIEDELAAGLIPGFDTVVIAQAENLASPAIEAARHLVEVEGLVAVIGHSNSAASLATAPIYNEHRVVQIAPTASAVSYSQAGPYSFRLVPPDDRQGRFLADQLQRSLPDGGRVAVAYVQDDYGRGLRAAFASSLNRERFHVAVELPHVEAQLDAADIAYTVDALAAARPDIIVWLARGAALAGCIAGIRERMPGVPVLGSDGLGTGGLASAPPGTLRGIRYVAYVDLRASEELRGFARRYRDRFGRGPTGSAALTYDAVRLAMRGMRAGARTGEDLRQYLVSVGRSRPAYRGITGLVTFDSHGDVDRGYVLLEAVPEP